MCDSGMYHEAIYDARNIYVGKVCDKCREQTLAPYRSDIFTNPAYEADEPIEEE